jgi:hypothetical protein
MMMKNGGEIRNPMKKKITGRDGIRKKDGIHSPTP